jgi:nucleoside-diphosphate-sugar epimerase
MKTALILGGGGTIGNPLAARLKSDGFWVRVVDKKYPEFVKSVADEYVIGDLRNPMTVREAFLLDNRKPFDFVFQLAAQMGGALYVFSGEYDSDIIYDSAMMNLHVANEAAISRVGTILFSSSACCYGESFQMDSENVVGLKESDAWKSGKPESPYGIEKLFSEQVYDAFRRNRSLNLRIVRFHNVFSEGSTFSGGREKAPAALARKVASAKDGTEIEILGDGNQKRSFIYISEALDAIMRLMYSDYQFPINVGSDELISINDLAKMVIEISGKNLTIKNVESNAVGVRGRNSDNTLIEQVLGWKPSMPLRTGMEKLYAWVNQKVNG